jgi:hypothetical protein
VSRDVAHSGSTEADTLNALLDRLVPTDDAPGALDLELGAKVRHRLPELPMLLERLDGLEMLPPDEQDRRLLHLDESNDLVFTALVETVHELYYADHRSWPSVGYTTHLPGRP